MIPVLLPDFAAASASAECVQYLEGQGGAGRGGIRVVGLKDLTLAPQLALCCPRLTLEQDRGFAHLAC